MGSQRIFATANGKTAVSCSSRGNARGGACSPLNSSCKVCAWVGEDNEPPISYRSSAAAQFRIYHALYYAGCYTRVFKNPVIVFKHSPALYEQVKCLNKLG